MNGLRLPRARRSVLRVLVVSLRLRELLLHDAHHQALRMQSTSAMFVVQRTGQSRRFSSGAG